MIYNLHGDNCMIYDIGGGAARGENITTVDINPKADIVHDLDKYPWPIKDRSVEYIRMYHVLEHLKDPFRAMQECHRILRPLGIVDIRVPWWKRDCFANPYHLHWFKPRWFRLLDSSHIAAKSMDTIMGSMDYWVIKDLRIRGRRRFWRTYEYRIFLGARKQ